MDMWQDTLNAYLMVMVCSGHKALLGSSMLATHLLLLVDIVMAERAPGYDAAMRFIVVACALATPSML